MEYWDKQRKNCWMGMAVFLFFLAWLSHPLTAADILSSMLDGDYQGVIKHLESSDQVDDALFNQLLRLAIPQGREEIVKLLLEKKDKIPPPGNAGITPLMIAARHGQVNIFKMLFARAPDLKTKGADVCTLLLCAVEGGTKVLSLT